MNVIFLCGGYRATYPGNFIPSLRTLERKLQPGTGIYVFHKTNAVHSWCKELQECGAILEFMDFDAPLYKRIKDLLRLIDKYGVNIVHVHFGDKVAASLCGHLRPQIKVFWHMHSDWSLGKNRTLTMVSLLALAKYFLLKLIGYKSIKLAVSSDIAEQVSGVYVPNGLAVERVYRVSDKDGSRTKMGIDLNSTVVLCFGWSPEVKGVDIAVNAIDILRQKTDVDFRLMLVTGQNDGNVRMWIDTKTKCGSRASFIHYCPPIEDVYYYHNAADVFLSASRSEGFSYALCEALSIAKPCVSSEIPGLKWAKDFESVVFFNSDNAEECAAALLKVISQKDEVQYTACREKDANKLLVEYNAERWAESIIDAYSMR